MKSERGGRRKTRLDTLDEKIIAVLADWRDRYPVPATAIAAHLQPVSMRQVQEALSGLAASGVVDVYATDGLPYYSLHTTEESRWR